MLARHRALHYFSPSQVDMYLGCKRKWAFRYVARIEVEQADSAKIGDRMHAQLETYLKGGSFDFTEVVDGVRIAELASSGLAHLPLPNTEGVIIEEKFAFTSPRTGFVWTGRKDVSGADSSVLPNFLVEGEKPVPFTLDHKSCGSLDWAKTSHDLLWDPQAVIYSKEAKDRTGSPLIDLRWVYYQKKGGKASKPVRLRMHEMHVERAFGIVEDVGLEMAAIKDAAPQVEPLANDPPPGLEGPPDLRELYAAWRAQFSSIRAAYINSSVRPTVSHCKAFGGCKYQHVCELTLAESQKRAMSSNSKDPIIDSLEARAAAQDGKAPAPVPTAAALPAWMGGGAAPAPAPATASSDVPAWMRASSDPAVQQAVTNIDAAKSAPAPAIDTKPVASANLSPGVTPHFGDPTTAPAPDGIPAWMTNGAGPAVNPPESKLPPPQLPPEPVATTPAPAAEKEEKKTTTRKRTTKKDGAPPDPPKDPLGADAHAALQSSEPNTQTLPREEHPARMSTAERAGDFATNPLGVTSGGFTLYVDCFPVGVAAEMVEKYIARAQDDIRATTAAAGEPVADYRILPFGQGGGVLAGCVARELDKDPCAHLVVRTNTHEAHCILGTLMARAARVVQGTR